jgi:nucleotide-binding universal stress UspA family protein
MKNMITRILCPVDFSPASMDAFEYAEELALAAKATLVLCHAFDRPATWELGDQSEPADESIKQQFLDVKATIPIERYLHAGSPGKVICWLAEDRACDLIIMGTHGRTGLKHLLFGSVAEYVLQHANCPVMTIRMRPEKEVAHEEPLVIPLPAPRFM